MYSNSYNDVWYSVDGTTWTRATAAADWEKRSSAAVIVFDNKLWVIGGTNPGSSVYYDDVWYSTDGIDWIAATRNAEFAANDSMAVWVMDSSIFIYTQTENKVWRSSNGVLDRKSTRLNSSHIEPSRMPSSA